MEYRDCPAGTRIHLQDIDLIFITDNILYIEKADDAYSKTQPFRVLQNDLLCLVANLKGG